MVGLLELALCELSVIFVVGRAGSSLIGKLLTGAHLCERGNSRGRTGSAQ